MASPAQEKRVPDLPVANAVTSNSLVLVVTASNTALPGVLDSTQLIPVKSLPVTFSATPANSTATTVSKGLQWTDGNYLYVATANNLVKRIGPLATF